MKNTIVFKTPLFFSVLEYVLLLYFLIVILDFFLSDHSINFICLFIISLLICYTISTLYYKVVFVYEDFIIIRYPTRLFDKEIKIQLDDAIFIRYFWNVKGPSYIEVFFKRNGNKNRNKIKFRVFKFNIISVFLNMTREKGIRHKCYPKSVFKNYHLE